MSLRTSFHLPVKQARVPAPHADGEPDQGARRARRVDYLKLIVWIAIIVLPWCAIGYGISRLSGH